MVAIVVDYLAALHQVI